MIFRLIAWPSDADSPKPAQRLDERRTLRAGHPPCRCAGCSNEADVQQPLRKAVIDGLFLGI